MDSSNDSALMHWVSPFGHRRLLRFISAYRRFSQISTSFIASDCLGIHRVRFIRLTSQPEDVFYQTTRYVMAARPAILCCPVLAMLTYFLYAPLAARWPPRIPDCSLITSAFLTANTLHVGVLRVLHIILFHNVCFNF